MAVRRSAVFKNPVPQANDMTKEDASDAITLAGMGYKQQFKRDRSWFDNMMISLGAMYFLGSVQTLLPSALQVGGTAFTWTNWIICSIFTLCVAASLAEICSKFPTAGSIYYWAYRCGGKKHGRFLAWLTCYAGAFAWIFNATADIAACTNFILSEPVIYGVAWFPSDPNDFNFRCLQYGLSVLLIFLSMLINLLPPRITNSNTGWMTGLILLALLYHFIWLPIGVAKNVGFNTADVALATVSNGNGADSSYNWFINILFPMGSLIGFDASGHVAEETKNSGVSSPKGIFRSCFWSAVWAFPLIIFLMFVNANNVPSSGANVAILDIYTAALGLNGQLVIAIISIILCFLNCTMTMNATSRLFFAIARDKVFPESFTYINSNGQPAGALWAVFTASAIVLASILPSAVAYNTLISGSVLMSLAAYSIPIYGRLFLTSEAFDQSGWHLGFYSRTVALIAFAWCWYCNIILSLPQQFPVDSQTFNFAPFMSIIFLLISLITWYIYGHTFSLPGGDDEAGDKEDEDSKIQAGTFAHITDSLTVELEHALSRVQELKAKSVELERSLSPPKHFLGVVESNSGKKSVRGPTELLPGSGHGGESSSGKKSFAVPKEFIQGEGGSGKKSIRVGLEHHPLRVSAKIDAPEVMTLGKVGKIDDSMMSGPEASIL